VIRKSGYRFFRPITRERIADQLTMFEALQAKMRAFL